MDRHPLHSIRFRFSMRPEQVEHLLSVVSVSAPLTLEETFPEPAKLLQGGGPTPL